MPQDFQILQREQGGFFERNDLRRHAEELVDRELDGISMTAKCNERVKQASTSGRGAGGS
jgi:hypothetical protein